MVRALAFHQCVPGPIPGPGVTYGLGLLVFPSPQQPTLIWFDLIHLI